MKNFVLKILNASDFNRWQKERHYLKRPIIRSKMVAHGVFVDNKLVGGLLWATPHFTKKRDLFGFPNTFDKWEVLMLARFYLVDGCEVIASAALSDSIGIGRGNRGNKRRGWRVQEDWVRKHPPRFPQSPYVPRLLISWSDKQWGHEGTIYKASGWELWDTTKSNGRRTGDQSADGEKKCWIMRLQENPRAHKIGQDLTKELVMQ
jgi:hypothetical protein